MISTEADTSEDDIAKFRTAAQSRRQPHSALPLILSTIV